MSSLFMKDERLEAEMAQLAMHLDQLGLTRNSGAGTTSAATTK